MANGTRMLALAVLCASCGSDVGRDGPKADAGADEGDGEADQLDSGAGEVDASNDAGSAGLSFFVTSDTSATGDLGGLAGADARCQALADAVGADGSRFHAYLSAEKYGESGQPVHARDRIGKGPWYNALGVLVAQDLDALHALTGDPELFVDEHGEPINGQWPGSPDPNEHDILTGSDAEGRVLVSLTCSDWTSESATQSAQVGHSDGLGPQANPAPPYNSWNSSHENGGCNDTGPRGGAGRIYCFAGE